MVASHELLCVGRIKMISAFPFRPDPPQQALRRTGDKHSAVAKSYLWFYGSRLKTLNN